MQDSDFRFRSCCPRANRNGYAHLDEDNSFAARQKSGADDIAVSTPYAAPTPKTARNAVLRVGNSIRAQMGNFWRAPRSARSTILRTAEILSKQWGPPRSHGVSRLWFA